MKREDLERKLKYHRIVTLMMFGVVMLQFYVGVCR